MSRSFPTRDTSADMVHASNHNTGTLTSCHLSSCPGSLTLVVYCHDFPHSIPLVLCCSFLVLVVLLVQMLCICLQHCSVLVCYHGGAILGVFHVQKTLFCPSAFILTSHINIIRSSHAIMSRTHQTFPSTEVSKIGTSSRIHFLAANNNPPVSR